MELNDILNGLNGCEEHKEERCGCGRRGFGNNFIWIIILLFLLCGFGNNNNNNAAVEPFFVESKKTKKKIDVCKTSIYTPIQEQCCGMPYGYGMNQNQGLGGFCGYGSMWWFIIIIIIFCGFGSFGRGIGGCNDICVTK